ncbi:glycoside hydrolase family 31 protein [Thermoanaerobacterium sp. RBIITD]|uniref:glycoside hydrolase family 31 protein n=1 Tax=Thermoanaerobacterium sp. RBIITD TaxID=1550240 RepID=UPI000BB72249|nr:glycoside hydrolase family 31 protein [Thermoanaerobacterium sp. RBIITD]SNX52868.1 alpha-D-xyloside xylohydrolase [Thermoanaerobacterium sp. RBIITD]
MESIFRTEINRLIWEYNGEKIWIEPWGKDSLRLRCTMEAQMPENRDWALLPQPEIKVEIKIDEKCASITNGKLTCRINENGFVKFENEKGETLLAERWQNRQNVNNRISLMIPGRELKPIPGGLYKAIVRFEGIEGEKFYGLGQRQEPFLNLKGCELELAQRNSQVNIPFVLSNRGYGFLWHNPAYGRVSFARNCTTWVAEVTPLIDYWVTAGDTPAEIVEKYMEVTGKPPMMPYFASGFWQCKLRYRTQEELLDVVREYKRRGLPISVIVIDFFHWQQQGEWCFDPKYWPDPEGMVKELKEMGVELMVSIWPTVDPRSRNYSEMKRKGYLVRTERGFRTQMIFKGNEVFVDFTNPDAQKYVWNKVKENYFRYGIRIFWLDEAEPEYSVYDFDNIRYYLGPNLEVGNIYPMLYAKAFYDGMMQEGINDVINLARCAWAGSQRYGAAVWSGDIHSNFETLRKQVCAGLNMGLSGIPWWTTDIGGFFGGDPNDKKFRELIIRWFQYGTFCPIFRLHGYRLPTGENISDGDTDIHDVDTCGPNEVWSFGEEAYEIIKDLLFLRERLRPYIMEQMKAAHEKGTPPMRPLFYDFPNDNEAWNIEDQFMFGPDILVAPVLYEGARSREVYLPSGTEWRDVNSGLVYDGGQYIKCDAPLKIIPLFTRKEASIQIKS